MKNLLAIELFDSALKAVPHQELGIYLLENNPWERAFIHAWRKNGHGRLLGVVHSTIRFWDLRYFVDSRSLNSTPQATVPYPDRVVVNGHGAREALMHAEFPEELIVEAEALRYLGHREDRREREPGSSRGTGEAPRVLILADLDPLFTRRMLGLLQRANMSDFGEVRLIAKFHPASNLDPGDFPGLKLDSTSAPVAEALQFCDLAYASNSTSAAVDAVLSGVPLAIILDPCTLNFSPLRGSSTVYWVSRPAELSELVRSDSANLRRTTLPREHFYLDSDLPRWRALLEEILGHGR